MNRRRYVAGGLAGVAAALAGCLNAEGGRDADCSDPWDPGISGAEPTLPRGASDSLRIEVERAMGVTVGVPELDGENVDVDVADASVDPPPDVQADSYPPQWYWEECTAVTVDVPVHVAADAAPGAYDYSVTANPPRESDSESVTREFTITVVDG